MSYDDLVQNKLYSKKVIEKIDTPHNAGFFTQEEAQQRGVRYAEGHAGSLDVGNALAFYWLVDPADGIVIDAKFQVFGSPGLIAAADAACELAIGKNYDQTKRIGVELIDKRLRDKPDIQAFPEEAYVYLNLAIEALEQAAGQCLDIPLSEGYVSPVPQTEGGDGYPGWLLLPYEKKLAVIEEVLNEDVRPYVELDAGGIAIQQLINDRELIIAYQGACTSCFSAIGATLATIQQILQTKVHPDLVVVPDMEGLQF